MQEIIAIPRIEAGGMPILFFPTEPARRGRIVCYAHIGQHAEADIGYYLQSTRPDKTGVCKDLIAEYEGLGPERCKLILHKTMRSAGI